MVNTPVVGYIAKEEEWKLTTVARLFHLVNHGHINFHTLEINKRIPVCTYTDFVSFEV